MKQVWSVQILIALLKVIVRQTSSQNLNVLYIISIHITQYNHITGYLKTRLIKVAGNDQ
jgi:hypothetical protein